MYLGEDRIKTIQSTTRGVVALLPFDPTGREGSTNGFILDEARMALSLGKPLLVLNEPGVSTPDDIVRGSFQGRPVDLSSDGDGAVALMSAFDAFEETAFRDSFDDRAFVFYAGSLLEESADAEDIETVIERFSNMRCVRGEKLPGDNVQRTIIDHIRRAAVVVADVSDDNRNTLIEAGIAMGAGTRLKLICRTPDSGQPMKKRFMFEGQELFWYRTAEERLALCCYFARQFRRRVYVIR
jgi:hypothetical protein